MKRRDLLVGLAAVAGGCASAATAPTTPTRGLWHSPSGALAIGQFPEFGEGLFAFDYRTMRVTPASTADLDVSRVEVIRRPFEVMSGGASLASELAHGADVRQRATIILIYGSGPAPKEALDLWAFWFMNAGFAVITYDKRGSGASSGDWREAGLETLAADANAVIGGARALGAPEPFIAWGGSQAGWIMPQLGAQRAISGMIMHAGSVMRPCEQIQAQVEAELRAYGFPEQEIEAALRYYALDTDVSRGVRPWTDIEVAHREAAASGAEWILGPPSPADAPDRTMIRLMADFDPAPFWRASNVPVLAIYGDRDWIVPADPNLAVLSRLVRADVLETRVLGSANHLMFVAETGLREEYRTLAQIHPEYFAAIANWLDGRF